MVTNEELIARLRNLGINLVDRAADRIEALVKGLDDATIKRAAWELEAKVQQARAENAEAERDAAYAKGFSDAETEISATAIGQQNIALHNQLSRAKAALDEALTEVRFHVDDAVKAWRAAEAAESRAERLEAALRWYEARVADCRKITRDGDTARHELDRDGGEIARAALKGAKP